MRTVFVITFIVFVLFVILVYFAHADGIWSGGGVVGVDGINNTNAIGGTDGITNVNASGSGGGGGCSNSFDFSQACNSQYLGGI